MATKKDIIADLDAVTDKLSSQVRTTAVAVLALTWGLLIGDSPAAQAISLQLKPSLVLLGGASVSVLFLDFLQYFAGYFSTMNVLREIERTGIDEGQYDYRSLFHRLRRFFFWAKQIALILTVIVLLTVLGRWILCSA